MKASNTGVLTETGQMKMLEMRMMIQMLKNPMVMVM